MFNSIKDTRTISRVGIVAAVYIAVTATISYMAFGPIQLRFSEILVLLAFINPVYGYGVAMAVFISNLLLSPLGLIDAIIGTASTLLAVLLISKTKNLFLATLWPTITAAIFVGPMLHIFLENVPLLGAIISVGIGQFIVLTCLGYPVFKLILNNKALYSTIKL